ncbi:MAG: TetR/AcrR family transcriptional regulator [Deltaproteobacteria bacterium]|nr:TetR/AcrR family transcriptional regulator [Deltaproteobacteria bacterium]
MTKLSKREEIFRAAMDLIAEHGFHGAPMAMIAARASVGAGTIYRYFESKDILILETYNQLEEKIREFVMEDYSEQLSIRESFLHIATRALNYFLAFPLHFRYFEQFHNSPYGSAHRRDKVLEQTDTDFVKTLFERGIAQKIIKDLPVISIFSLSMGPLIAVARDHILGFLKLDDQLIKSIVEACWDSIKR